jgi:UDP-N-acetylglucosamine 4-epimerase
LSERVIPLHYRRVREQLAANPKRWLITGVAGFIGSNLLDELLGLGQYVVGLDNFSTGYRGNMNDVRAAHPLAAERFSFIEGDIRDIDACRAACAGVDYVLHQAALASVPKSIEEPLVTHAVNVDGFVNMLVAARDAGVKRFVYASSSAVYGDASLQPQVESVIGRPLSPYAANKSVNETYAAAFHTSYGLESIGLRYYNIFGRRQDPDGAYAAVIPRWIAKLLDGTQCSIFGDGETTRDFCHVANVAQANILAATVAERAATGQVFNIASAQSVTLNELFAMIKEQLAATTGNVTLAEVSYEPFRAGDIRHSSGSIEKARRLLGFAPSHTVRDGLADALPWYVAQHAAAGIAEVAYGD